jgi:Fe-S cluster assembly scaffold protein SufB
MSAQQPMDCPVRVRELNDELQAVQAEVSRLTATVRALTEEKESALDLMAEAQERGVAYLTALTSLEGAIRAKAEGWLRRVEQTSEGVWKRQYKGRAGELLALLTPSAGSASPTPGDAKTP